MLLGSTLKQVLRALKLAAGTAAVDTVGIVASGGLRLGAIGGVVVATGAGMLILEVTALGFMFTAAMAIMVIVVTGTMDITTDTPSLGVSLLKARRLAP